MNTKISARALWTAAYRNARLERSRAQKLAAEAKEQAEKLAVDSLHRQLWAEDYPRHGRMEEEAEKMEQAKTLLRRFRKNPGTGTEPFQLFSRWCSLERVAKATNRRVKSMRLVGVCPVTGRAFKWTDGEFVSAKGLGSMVKEGIQTFEEETGVQCIPYNLVFTSMSGGLAVGPAPFRHGGRKVSPQGADRLLNEYGRIRGWLKAAAKLPGVNKLIQKTQSSRGVNSPYTTLGLPVLWDRFPSPGALERKLWAVKLRAEAILSAYEGDIKPSWKNLADALTYERRVGKAAVIAVALQLGFEPQGEHQPMDEKSSMWVVRSAYRQARQWLVERRSAAYPVADVTDGVSLRLEATPELVKLGVTVTRGLVLTETVGRRHQVEVPLRKIVRLVRKDGRSYHSERGSATDAIKQAVGAWKRQDELAAEEAKRAVEMRERNATAIAFLEGNEFGFCPLISREDSYAAGNCSRGTESWVMEHGWRAKQFVPGTALIPYLDDDRVRRVVNAARQRRVNEIQAVAA